MILDVGTAGYNDTSVLRRVNKPVLVHDSLFVLLLYIPVNSYVHYGTVSSPNHIFFLGKLEQAVNHYFVHILSLVTDINPYTTLATFSTIYLVIYKVYTDVGGIK